jgi:hypothetical protein
VVTRRPFLPYRTCAVFWVTGWVSGATWEMTSGDRTSWLRWVVASLVVSGAPWAVAMLAERRWRHPRVAVAPDCQAGVR